MSDIDEQFAAIFAKIDDLAALVNRERPEPGSTEAFYDLASRTGEIYAHPETAAIVRAKLEPVGIRVVEHAWLEPGRMYAMEPPKPTFAGPVWKRWPR